MADAFTSETYNALCRDAEGYLARGLAEQARELLLKATGLIGTRARARSLLADACMQLTLWDEAKSQLEALATLEVDNIYTHFRLGQVLEETSDYELARDNFFVVLDMNPDHHGAKVALSRLENLSNKPSKGKTSLVEGQQIFADSTQDEGIFAEDSSSSIDALLNTIGMGEKADVPGVEDLLDTIGMSHKEEKKEEKPAVDFSSIFGAPAQKAEFGNSDSVSDVFDSDEPADLGSMFGGGETTPEPAAEEPQTDLGAMFGVEETAPEPESTETAPEPVAEETQAADLGAMFGGSETVAEPESTETVPEPVAEETQAADIGAMFGGSETVPEPESTETTPEPVAQETQESDLGAMFGGDETVPEPAAEEPQTDLGAMFGGNETVPEPESTETVPEPVAEETQVADIGAMFGGSETAPEPESTETTPEPAADLGAMFGGSETVAEPESTETVPEPVAEETQESDLGAMFGGSETVAEPESTETVPEPVAEETQSTDIGAMFGGSETAPEPESTETTPEPAAEESQAADLGAMFGGSETVAEPESTETVPEPVAEETQESDLGAMFGGSETAPEPESTETVPDPAVEETRPEPGKEEFVAAETKADEEEPAAEITVVVPVMAEDEESSDRTEIAPEESEDDLAESGGLSRYTLLPGDGNSLCGISLENDRVRVIRGLVAALDGSVLLEGDILRGSGMVWMGQGSLTPVVVSFKNAMTVRIDRIAARPAKVTHEACGIASVPSLCKLHGAGNSCSILLFVNGRIKKLKVAPGLRVRNGSVVAADPGVSFAEEETDFLAVSGKGTLIVTG